MNYRGVVNASWRLLTKNRRQCAQFDDFLTRLSELGDPVLFGGAVRDAYLYKDGASPRDYDFVVAGVESAEIYSALRTGPWCFRRNRFGGFKVQVQGIKIDVWSLESTWAFRQQLVKTVALSTLPSTVFLNVDSVAMSLKDSRVEEQGFYQAIREHELDIVLETNPFPALNIVRALYLKHRLEYRLSQKLKAYIQRWVNAQDEPIETLRACEHRRYGVATVTDRVLGAALVE